MRSEPRSDVFAFDTAAGTWVPVTDLATPTMDHRGIVRAGRHVVIVGGLQGGQRVTDYVATGTLSDPREP